jgi:GTPase SAR1 family protein
VTPEEREVSHERAVKFAESVGLPYMEVSAEENKNVTEVFEKLADSILENLTKDSTPNMQQPNRVILSKQQKPKKQWCSC